MAWQHVQRCHFLSQGCHFLSQAHFTHNIFNLSFSVYYRKKARVILFAMATLSTITVAAPVIPELGFSSKGEPLATSMTASALKNEAKSHRGLPGTGSKQLLISSLKKATEKGNVGAPYGFKDTLEPVLSSSSDEILREELNRHGQPTDGPKDVLLYRLRVYHEPASQFLRFKTLPDLQGEGEGGEELQPDQANTLMINPGGNVGGNVSALTVVPSALAAAGAPYPYTKENPSIVVPNSHWISILGRQIPEIWTSQGVMPFTIVEMIMVSSCSIEEDENQKLGGSIKLELLNRLSSYLQDTVITLGRPTSFEEIKSQTEKALQTLPPDMLILKKTDFQEREVSLQPETSSILNLVTANTWSKLDLFLTLSHLINGAMLAVSRQPSGRCFNKVMLMNIEFFGTDGMIPPSLKSIAETPGQEEEVLLITKNMFLNDSALPYKSEPVLSTTQYLLRKARAAGVNSGDKKTAMDMLPTALSPLTSPNLTRILNGSPKEQWPEVLSSISK